MSGFQLHRPLDMEAMLPTGLGVQAPTQQDASNLPCFYYPNGDFCFEVNAFILSAWKYSNYSTTNRGGTLRQWVMQLSEFVRFLESNALNVLTVTDSYFVLFVNGLMAEKDASGEDKRSAETVRAIGSKCLEFLAFATEMYGYANFVSPGGIVKGCKIESSNKRKYPSEYRRVVWHHHSFPLSSSGGEGSPILAESLVALKMASRKRARPVAARLKILISVLESLGCRRAEAARIRVSDIMTAYHSSLSSPLLRIPMVKGRVGSRLVPISHSIISTWSDYIVEFRNPRLAELRKKNPDGGILDHDYLFINLRNGQPLGINTITNDISDLKFASGIAKRAHPHMFRHRFITNKFKELIVEYDLQNTDVMRRAIANSELIKTKLKEWTGHKMVESLDRYIHLAFSELAGMPAVVERVNATAEYKAARTIFKDLEEDRDAGQISQEEFESKATRLLGEFFVGMDAESPVRGG